MNKIKAALTRKFGPLPAWAWLAVIGIVVYFYRTRLSSGGVQSGTGTGSVAPAGPPPQPDTVLQPGESVYDPNAGTLTTAPGTGTGTGGGTDPNAAIAALAQAIEDAINANTQGGSGNGGSDTSTGDGKGDKRTGGSKGAGKGGGKVTGTGKKLAGLVGSQRARSTASVRGKSHTPKGRGRFILSNTGERTRGNANLARGGTRTRGTGTGEGKKRYRTHAKTAAVAAVTRQRPTAATQPARKPNAAPNHRPSAPPPRTQRKSRGRK